MTNLKIKVIPSSKINKIIEQPDGSLKIKLQAPAIEGKANKALIAFLSEHFQKPKNKIILVSGEKARTKTVKIED
ncbi:MAG: DUF167 domain-containing protein [Candidatus Parcubacteria bacterium]|nr:DUF167 domain-containing protein [Candidatus Parcubacteria bacterium]